MKTFKILTEAYGDETLSLAYVFEWHKWYSGDKDSVVDYERAERPRKRRPELRSDVWLLHQDNKTAPTALFVKQFLTIHIKNITVLGHPPYSPDLAS
ncbi:hypothetical protein TNCV_366951 [Trichonephila clavipes]|nr:hypothetical protein TNCV_366951 [Trichonephila clavipes]